MENETKVKFVWKLIISIIVIVLIIFLIYSFENKNKIAKEENFIVLYSGYPLDNTKMAVQSLEEVDFSPENKTKYNVAYYNYSNIKFVNSTLGTLTETNSGKAKLTNVNEFSISKEYNAMPRKIAYEKTIPTQLNSLLDTASLDIISCDLDNDSKIEHIVISTIDIKEDSNEDEEIFLQATSSVDLYDSEYTKLATLAELKEGFWGGIKTEENKIFIKKTDVYILDIDNDNIMEILLCLPTYEGTEISILKYSNGEITGTTNVQASVAP